MQNYEETEQSTTITGKFTDIYGKKVLTHHSIAILYMCIIILDDGPTSYSLKLRRQQIFLISFFLSKSPILKNAQNSQKFSKILQNLSKSQMSVTAITSVAIRPI